MQVEPYNSSTSCPSFPAKKDTIPKIQNKYSRKWNWAASFPIPTFIFLRAIYVFPGAVCLFCCRKIGGPIVGIYKSLTETWMRKLGLRPRSFWFLVIHKSDLLCSVYYIIEDRFLQYYRVCTAHCSIIPLFYPPVGRNQPILDQFQPPFTRNIWIRNHVGGVPENHRLGWGDDFYNQATLSHSIPNYKQGFFIQNYIFLWPLHLMFFICSQNWQRLAKIPII